MLNRAERYGGKEPSKRRKARVASLYSILNCTGSQWSSDERGVTCYFSHFRKTSFAAFFWIFWRRRSFSDGKLVRTELQSSRRLRIRDEINWTVAPRVRNELTEAIFLSAQSWQSCKRRWYADQSTEWSQDAHRFFFTVFWTGFCSDQLSNRFH